MRGGRLSGKPIATRGAGKWRRKRLKSLDSRPEMAPLFSSPGVPRGSREKVARSAG